MQELDNALSQLRQQQKKAQQALLLLLQSENQIESEIKQNTVRLEHHRERKEHLLDRRGKLEELLKELSKQVKEKGDLVQEASASIEQQKNLHQQIESRVMQLNQEIQSDQKELEAIQIDWAESKAREKVLIRLREEMEGFSPGTKCLLQEGANPRSPLYQKVKGLYEYIKPEDGAEVPVSAALKGYSQTIVVETLKDYEEVCAFALSRGLNDFSLLCLDFLSGAEMPMNWKNEAEPLLRKVQK